jgi:hypothetical protein
MFLKYKGKRSTISNSIEHVKYVFTKENDHTCEVPDHVATRLLRTGLYLPVEKPVEKPKVKPKAKPKPKVVEKSEVVDEPVPAS